MRPSERLARIRRVVSDWTFERIDEARRLEGGVADAAADALVDALLAHGEEMSEALADAELTPAEDEFRAVHTMESEVSSGGFEQFFDNCGREEVVLAGEGCRRIGAEHFAEIVDEALALVEDVPDDEWPDDLEEALTALDERFFDAYRDVEELLLLRLRYMAAHPDEFRGTRGA